MKTDDGLGGRESKELHDATDDGQLTTDGTMNWQSKMAMGVIAAGILLASPALCALSGYVETWDKGTAGWVRYDVLNMRDAPLTNASGYLQIIFDEQSLSMPEVNVVRATAESSGGAFVGDYMTACVTNVTFKFYCEKYVPSELRLYFYSGASSNWWYYPLSVSGTGIWQECSVPMDCWRGWRRSTGVNAGVFKGDLGAGDWIGLEIQRNGSLDRQLYGLDDFSLHGADKLVDSDGDGMSDWAEFLAGTNPHDPADCLSIEPVSGESGIVLKWKSVANHKYGVFRSRNLMFKTWPGKIATGLQATPPLNVYKDETAVESGAYFYRIEMEE